MSYIDGFVIPIPKNNVDDYKKMAEHAGKIWMEHGALLYQEAVLEDARPQLPEGMNITFFEDLTSLKEGETVIFALILYTSREHRDEVNAKVMADPRMQDDWGCGDNMPFNMSRMSFGGFKSIVDLS